MADDNLWQQSIETVAERDAFILQQQVWTDCAFRVGPDDTSAKVFRCHKQQFSKTSSVFAAMLHGELASDDVIRIPDTSPEAFAAMMYYMYHGRVRLENFEVVCGLLYLAKKYRLPTGMVRKCRSFLWQQIHPDNVWRALKFAAANDETKMYETAQQVVRLKTSSCLRQPGLLEAPLSELLQVVKCPHLNLDSEIQLYDASVFWANDQRLAQRQTELEEQNKALQAPSSASSAEDSAAEKDAATSVVADPAVSETMEEGDGPAVKRVKLSSSSSLTLTVRKVMEPLLPHIRFLAMDPQEFADGPGRCGVLNKDEALAVVLNLLRSQESQHVPLPENICTIKAKRDASNLFYINGAEHFDEEEVPVDQLERINTSFAKFDMMNSGFLCQRRCLGVVVPTQVKEDAQDGETYPEDLTLYCVQKVRDVNGEINSTLISLTNFRDEVPYNSVVDVPFSEGFVLHFQNELSVSVVFHKSGKYPIKTDPQLVEYGIVTDTFNDEDGVSLLNLPQSEYFCSFAFSSY